MRSRILSFSLILALGFLLIVSLVTSAAIAALGKWWDPVLGGWELLAQAVDFVIGFGLTTAMFALIYRARMRPRTSPQRTPPSLRSPPPSRKWLRPNPPNR